MATCKSCGKKYSRWTAPVSAMGICAECFRADLPQERPIEAQANVGPAQVANALPPKETSTPHAKKFLHRPPVSRGLLVETLGVTLIFFGARTFLDLFGPEWKSAVTARGLVAGALTYIGWILLVVSLLNRSGNFNWRLPASKREWLTEFQWGALLLVISGLAKVIVKRIGLELHVPSSPTVWTEALRNPSIWIAFQVITPLSATYQELVCRVYMQSRLTQVLRGHSVLVVLISSSLFMGIHGYAPLQSLGVFVAGVIYGASYQANGKIPRLVIAHAANNMLGGFV